MGRIERNRCEVEERAGEEKRRWKKKQSEKNDSDESVRQRGERCVVTKISPESPDTIQIRTSCQDNYEDLEQ